MRLGRLLALGLPALLVAAAAWSSVTTVDRGQLGVVLRFGRATRQLPPGLHVTLPWPVERVTLVDTEISRRMPVGYKLVDSERGIAPAPQETQWLTGDTNIVELRANVLYRITDPVAWLYGVAGAADGEHRSFVLRKLGEAVLTELVSGITIDDLLVAGRGTIQIRARDEIDRRAGALGLGVSITSVELLGTQPPLMVVAAFEDVTDAQSDRARQVEEARSYAGRLEAETRAEVHRRLDEAEAFAAEVTSGARGAADYFGSLAAEVGAADSPAARRLWFDAVQRLIARSEVRTTQPSVDGQPVRVYLTD